MLIRLRDLDIIAEDLVVAYAKVLYACLLPLLRFHAGKPRFAVFRGVTVFVQLLVVAVADYAAVFYAQGRIVYYGGGEQGAYVVHRVQSAVYALEFVGLEPLERSYDSGQLFQ